MQTSVNVIIPKHSAVQIGLDSQEDTEKIPVLFLLHGLSDNHSAWLRRSNIEVYAEEMGFAVVMPEVHRSFYTDTSYGLNYASYIGSELPSLIGKFFNLSTERENTYIAGLSMGGYGAIKTALLNPESFQAAASLSGVLDLMSILDNSRQLMREGEFESIFGNLEQIDQSLVDLIQITKDSLSNNLRIPPLFSICGKDDFLFTHHKTFADHCQNSGVCLEAREAEGMHNWRFWDREIPEVLNWLKSFQK